MLPDESLYGSSRRSIMDTFELMVIVERAGEVDRRLELDASMTIVDAGRSSSVVLAKVEPSLREVYREPEIAARVAYPE